MEAQIVRIGFAVPLTKAQWDKLQTLDFLTVVQPALVNAGAAGGSVEYCGHFGMNVYFDTYNDCAPEGVVKALENLLMEKG